MNHQEWFITLKKKKKEWCIPDQKHNQPKVRENDNYLTFIHASFCFLLGDESTVATVKNLNSEQCCAIITALSKLTTSSII